LSHDVFAPAITTSFDRAKVPTYNPPSFFGGR